MRRRATALSRLVVVVVLLGAGVAMVIFGVMAAGGELAFAALGMSRRPDLGVAVLVGLVGGECLIVAFVLGLRAHTTTEEC